MAKNEIGEYDETDSGNTDISGIGLSDATLIDQLDNIARAQMGALKRWFKSSLFRLRDSTDQTKLLAFDLSGQTTALTRTQKTPNYNGSLSSQALGTAIASASSIDLGAASGSAVHITGTTTITALGTADAGIEKTVIFDAALILTHNATSLILPGAANITTAAGDAAIMVSEGSGNWRCVAYRRAASRPPSDAQAFKWWAVVTVTAGTPTLQASENVASITDVGTGQIRVNLTNAFSTTRWSHYVSIRSNIDLISYCTAKNEGDITFLCVTPGGSSTDPQEWDFGGIGTLA